MTWIEDRIREERGGRVPQFSEKDVDGNKLTLFRFSWGSVYGNEKLERHKLGGPAVAIVNITGNIKIYQWYKNDQLHNPNGPAIHSFTDTENAEYWIEGYNIGYICFQLQYNKLSQKEMIQLFHRADAAHLKNKLAIFYALADTGLNYEKIEALFVRAQQIRSLAGKDL